MEDQSRIDPRIIGGTVQIRSHGKDTQLITGTFPYSFVGRISTHRREKIAPRAFQPLDAGEVHLLAGHNVNHPIARTGDGSLTLFDDDDNCLAFTATIPPRELRPSWIQDTISAIKTGLISGISPGFYIKKDGIVVRGDLQIVRSALLTELSIVTKPVYKKGTAHVRQEQASAEWIRTL